MMIGKRQLENHEKNNFQRLTASMTRAKLLDFGLSRVATQNARPLGGTVIWMAPEVRANPDRSWSPIAEVFSLGCVALFCLRGLRPPWAGSLRETPDLFNCAEAPRHESVVQVCTLRNPSLRPTMTEVHLLISGSHPREVEVTVQWEAALKQVRSSCSPQVCKDIELQAKSSIVAATLLNSWYMITPLSNTHKSNFGSHDALER